MWFFALFVLAGALTFLLTPAIIAFAKKFGFLDLPSRPHPAIIHKKPLPRAGGLATFLGIFLTLGIFFSFGHLTASKPLVGILAASFLIVATGLADDHFDLNPYLRLATNFLAILLVVGAGVGISGFTNPLGGFIHLDSLRLSFTVPSLLPFAGPHSILVYADIFAFLWIAWIMNALNWSSGVDGQLSGIAGISFLILGIVSLRLPGTTQILTASLAFAAAGSYLGFLPWSFYPQKIMPGYGGSALAGFLLATLSILSGAKLATAALVLAVPIIDGLWAVFRRIYHGRSPVWGDREHLHHRLLQRGWSVPKIALFYYSTTALLGVAALTLSSRGKLFAIVMVAIVILGVIFTANQTSGKYIKKS